MFFLLFIAQAFALELSEVQGKVLAQMPELLAAEEKLEASRAKLEATQGAFDTKIKGQTRNQVDESSYNRFWEAKIEKQTPFFGSSLFAGRRQGNGTYATYEGKSTTTAVGEMFAGFEIPLLRDRAMDQYRLDRNSAQLQVKISEQDLLEKSMEVLLKASATYWKWVTGRHKLIAAQDWVKAQEERQLWLEKKVKAGDQGNIKLVDSRRSLAKAHAKLAEVERELRISEQELALYLGGAAKIETATLPELPENFDLNSTLARKELEVLPAYRKLRLESEVLEQEKEFARSLQLPELRVGVEGARDLGGVPAVGRTDEDQLRVALRLEIPIENRKGDGTREKVARELAAIRYRRQWLETQWDTRVAQNKAASEKMKEQLKWQTQELTDTVRMKEAEITKWQNGASDIFFVNLREQDEVKVRLDLIETKTLLALLKLERQSLDGSLLKMITQKDKP